MTTIFRHGGEAHVVRPDRVHRTGVLTSIVGYQPQMDVQAVAQAFTQGPPSGTVLQGLGGLGAGGFRLFNSRRSAMTCCCNNACTSTDETCCYGGTARAWGMRGLGGSGFDNFKARMRAFIDRFRFKRAIVKAIENGQMTMANTAPGPASMEASMVAPQMQSQMTLLAHLTRNSNSHVVGPLAAATFALQNRRPFTYYHAG